MSYNRMRASDFGKIFSALPFKTEFWEVTAPTEAEIRSIENLPPNAEFAGYDLRDLGSSHLLFALRRL
jgi:hypothetical protein